MLEQIVAERGVPHAIRCDNGPEQTSRHFLAWCVKRQIELVHATFLLNLSLVGVG